MSAKKANKKAQRRLTIYTIIFIMVVAGIIYYVPNYIIQIIDKYQEKNELLAGLDDLQEEQENLEKEVAQLSDASYVAKIARQKYLFSKDGEIIIKVNDSAEEKKNTKNETFNLEINSDYLTGGVAALIIMVTIIKMKRKKRKTRHK